MQTLPTFNDLQLRNSLQEQQNVVTMLSGVPRMKRDWRIKMWIDFERDRERNLDSHQAYSPQDEENGMERFQDVEELRVDNHTATDEYLSDLLGHTQLGHSKLPLLRLEIFKVLFTASKAQILGEMLSDEACTVVELTFDKCRASSEKMGLLFEAIAKNKSVVNLSLKNMNIPRDSLTAMVDMLGTNRSIQLLTLFNTGLSDNSVQLLVAGLEQKHGLSYLDLRQNTFEKDGFCRLAKAMAGHSTLLTLRINAIQIGSDELAAIQALFNHSQCTIQNLEIGELEISDSQSKELIDAVSSLQRLFTFDFSFNRVAPETARSLVTMINKYEKMEILCLDHCEIHDVICESIFAHVHTSHLQFLNLSWNHLSSDSLMVLTTFLNQASKLEKLALQHNRLGGGNFKMFSIALMQHRSLLYLDLSQNRIQNRDFHSLYQAIQSRESVLKTFQCRKNKVGGPKIDSILNLRSAHLTVLDLTQNCLSQSNAEILLDYARDNIKIEQIELARNHEVSASIINAIEEECRQNVLIQKKILTLLPLTHYSSQQTLSDFAMISAQVPKHSYEGFDTSALMLKDQRIDYVDFIAKFLKQCYHSCMKLSFQRVHLNRAQDQLSRLFDGLSQQASPLRNLRVLHIEDTHLEDKPLRKLLRGLRRLHHLSELHLVNLEPLEDFMDTLCESLMRHKELKVLDLRQISIRKRNVDALVPLLQKNKVIEHVDISNAIISKVNMQHLWLALHVNVSVRQLNYSQINFMAISEMTAIEAELKLNQTIADSIVPIIEKQRSLTLYSSSNKSELSLRGVELASQNNPAIIKYIKGQHQLRALDLSATGLHTRDITQFLTAIQSHEIKLSSLNLSENPGVDDRILAHLCHLFTSNSTLVNLVLDQTNVTMAGVTMVLEAIKNSLKVRTLSFKDCYLDFGEDCRVVSLLEQNISLTRLGYQENRFELEFSNAVERELALNTQIVDKIFPQLVDQELSARVAQQQKLINEARKTGKLKTKTTMKLLRAHSKRASNNQLDLEDQKSLRRRQKTKRANNSRKQKQRSSSVQIKADEAANIVKKKVDIREAERHIQKLNRDSEVRASWQGGRNRDRNRDRNLTPEPHKAEPTILVTQEDAGNGTGRIFLKSFNESYSHAMSGDDESARSKVFTDSTDSAFESDGDAQSVVEEVADIQHSNEGFKIDMRQMNLKEGIAFITKFTKVFRKIESIDFGNKNLPQEHLTELSETLKLNKYIQNVFYKKKGISNKAAHMLQAEIEKNKAIAMMNKSKGSGALDPTQTQLDLADQRLKDLSFVPKMVQQFNNLETLNLSNSDLRSAESITQLCQLIEDNQTISKLVVRNCMLNGKALAMLADALYKQGSGNLRELDIRDNPVQDPQLKVLFSLLQNNKSLLEVRYTLYEEENISILDKVKKMQAEQADLEAVVLAVEHELEHAHHELHVPLWQKLVFPIWCWKSMIHDKHEAFRFKYDTKAMARIESFLMPSIRRALYFWSIVYYFIVFAAPYIFIEHECEKTFKIQLFYMYAAYCILTGAWEIHVVYKIQRLLGNKNLLSFNKWHVVELFMGTVARTDTFLDICFVHIIGNCASTYKHWLIPAAFFAIINLLFPMYMLLRLLKKDFGNALVQPLTESTCFAAFIRENMLLATVLDSFCINNSFYFLGQPFVFGKLMGYISFFTQDFPQLTIHVLFKLVIISEAQYKLKTQTLLLVGVFVSSLALCISIFNMIMCSQNEFNPLLVEKELVMRRACEQRQKRLEEERKAQIKRAATSTDITSFKKQIQKQLFKSVTRGRGHSHPAGAQSMQLQPFDAVTREKLLINQENGKMRSSFDKIATTELGTVPSLMIQKGYQDQMRDYLAKQEHNEASEKMNAYLGYYLAGTNKKGQASQMSAIVEESPDQQQVEEQETTRNLLSDQHAHSSPYFSHEQLLNMTKNGHDSAICLMEDVKGSQIKNRYLKTAETNLAGPKDSDGNFEPLNQITEHEHHETDEDGRSHPQAQSKPQTNGQVADLRFSPNLVSYSNPPIVIQSHGKAKNALSLDNKTNSSNMNSSDDPLPILQQQPMQRVDRSKTTKTKQSQVGPAPAPALNPASQRDDHSDELISFRPSDPVQDELEDALLRPTEVPNQNNAQLLQKKDEGQDMPAQPINFGPSLVISSHRSSALNKTNTLQVESELAKTIE